VHYWAFANRLSVNSLDRGLINGFAFSIMNPANRCGLGTIKQIGDVVWPMSPSLPTTRPSPQRIVCSFACGILPLVKKYFDWNTMSPILFHPLLILLMASDWPSPRWMVRCGFGLSLRPNGRQLLSPWTAPRSHLSGRSSLQPTTPPCLLRNLDLGRFPHDRAALPCQATCSRSQILARAHSSVNRRPRSRRLPPPRSRDTRVVCGRYPSRAILTPVSFHTVNGERFRR
jgi:hypothetical protein